jgi:hypothetical protein
MTIYCLFFVSTKEVTEIRNAHQLVCVYHVYVCVVCHVCVCIMCVCIVCVCVCVYVRVCMCRM